jgi:hypothetical protein
VKFFVTQPQRRLQVSMTQRQDLSNKRSAGQHAIRNAPDVRRQKRRKHH